MLRSMFSSVSGLRGHQTMMDVIGNNISNVNTVGYKTGMVIFQDLLSQQIQGAGNPVVGNQPAGGTNPVQVGIGVRIGAITNSFTQGASQLTGRATDVSVQGEGFFVVRKDGQSLFTRAGSFSLDANGRLVSPNGGLIQGWRADPTGKIDTNGSVGDILMTLGQANPPTATTKVSLGGNLDATVPATFPGPEYFTNISVYDQQGKKIDLMFGFKMTAANTWSVQAYGPDGSDADTNPDTIGSATSLTFSATTGQLTAPTTPPTITIPTTLGQFANPITLDFGTAGTPEALHQFVGSHSAAAVTQDGTPLGSVQSFSVGPDGVVTGVFSNGLNRPIAQIALANFANPAGLEKIGESTYRPTGNSGTAQIGEPATAGRGNLMGGTLEMSNVDLSQEFTNLIVAQRGFQANSRVITAADEILQDLVNLKR